MIHDKVQLGHMQYCFTSVVTRERRRILALGRCQNYGKWCCNLTVTLKHIMQKDRFFSNADSIVNAPFALRPNRLVQSTGLPASTAAKTASS